jgi:predicted TIM-barrel fold metal-dependent hydrolase
VTRRTFLASAAGLAALPAAAQKPGFPIVDTHIHLFDTNRPGGIPWPPKDDPIRYKPTFPSRFRKVAEPLGVTGAIEVECSPLLEDNQWVLDVCEKDKIMLGTVGDLEPSKPEYRSHLERFGKNPLFLGIRYGYLWGRNLREELAKPAFIEGLKALAGAGLTLDTANPSVQSLEDVVRLTDQVPELRVVLDHLPKLLVARDDPERPAHDRAMREISARPQVYVKVSAVLQKTDQGVSYDLEDYRPRLDEIWDAFGADRVLYGSDWPNSLPLGSYAQVFNLVREYFEGKGRENSEKYFWKNSQAAYRWKKRV